MGGTPLGAIDPNLVGTGDFTVAGLPAAGCAALYDVHDAVTGAASELAFVQSLFQTLGWDPSISASLLAGPEKSDSTDPTFLWGTDWTLTAGNGSWSIAYGPLTMPASSLYDLVVYVKQGTAAAVFYLGSFPLSSDGGSLSGSYQFDVCPSDPASTSPTCVGSTAISHMSLFVADPPTPPAQVPLPGTLALLGAGLGAAGIARRRARADK